ncbi:septum site-determining protein MinC [Anaerostipes sp. MSJ-23]|mgnify:CR=1 FL=1|uniref:septum site-determining protein MinC n=1 Tax=unclassified Anaerostipes TaxID=2635253 RepID=UPI001C10C9C6|nr:septum site-determining protein MinC [Anaerostipes sp. MSJ-23]MBU5458976.1 septum site-determining protein MinC [Anaerostipes sp. MSJ-23]
MRNPVLLKGNDFGLTIVMDPEIDFSDLKEIIGEKFRQAKAFFNTQKQIALKIEGRKLTSEQVEELLKIISENSSLTIAYVMEGEDLVDTSFRRAVEQRLHPKEDFLNGRYLEMKAGSGHFYRGTLRSGQSLESDGSVVVVGDVNPGATVKAKGNIVVLGCAKGFVFAGACGDDRSFIAALDMQPMQIRIGDHIARCSDDEKDKKKKKNTKGRSDIQQMEAQIAFVENGNVYIEPISRALLNEITI